MLIRKQIHGLLDLKQKQASVFEADKARESTERQAELLDAAAEQAKATIRQGNTLMVFTLTTVVFVSRARAYLWRTNFLATCFFHGRLLRHPNRLISKVRRSTEHALTMGSSVARYILTISQPKSLTSQSDCHGRHLWALNTPCILRE